MKTLYIVSILLFAALAGRAQVDEICGEAGFTPSLDSPFAHTPYVFGRVKINGANAAKPPKIAVILTDSQQPANRQLLGKSGNYCFKRTSSGGTLVVEVDGSEAARRALPSFGSSQQREDFELNYGQTSQPPAVVSSKFARPPNEKTVELYKKAAEAEKNKETSKVVDAVKEIVSIDAADFIAWAKLGGLYFEQNSLTEADAAFRKALELRMDYTPAWINVGKMRVFQKQYPAAIEIFKHVLELEPNLARGHQLLGEAYLQNKQGSLGVESLNQALKLDPVGMAESHLMLARLYDLAGSKKMAAKEYEVFLTKVPEYAERKKLEKYIKDNSN